MDWKLEIVVIPVSDVDRAKSFYTEQVGFVADHDHQVSDGLRLRQGQVTRGITELLTDHTVEVRIL